MNIFKMLKIFTNKTSKCCPTVKLLCTEAYPVAVKPKKPKSQRAHVQYFLDRLTVETVGGKGGDGCISFLQLWSNDKAGPDGGDGGNGGHVIFKATRNVLDLLHIPKRVMGRHGERGFNKDCSGKSAKHEFIHVPIGTIVRNNQGIIVGDLNEEEAMFIAARGGAGGRGNKYFVSDTLQTPQVAEFGAEGEVCRYTLEVKTMAHIGMIGMPNAGKSTLLRAISRARPQVAAYAFTTLKPHIGMVQYSDQEQIAVADLPGLIEGSHKNEGLGIDFLKHSERCCGILMVIDLSSDNPFRQFEILRYEMSMFSEDLANRPYIVVGNKIDLKEAQDNVEEFQSKIKEKIIVISAKEGKNLSELLFYIRKVYDSDLKERTAM